MTGINAILYFTPQLFASLGSRSSMALISAIIVNGTFLVAGIASIFLVDRVGRKPLLVGGAVAMAIFQIAICIVLALKFDPYGNDGLEDVYVYLVLVLLCLFTFSFGLTWGPLGTYYNSIILVLHCIVAYLYILRTFYFLVDVF